MRKQNDVMVVIGAGGMGAAVARRMGAGRTVLLADYSEGVLSRAAEQLRIAGYAVAEQIVDVSDRESVKALSRKAAECGPVTTVVHTAGLSQAQAPAGAILNVNLLGASHVLDVFGDAIAPGGCGVIVASMAAERATLSPDAEARLANTPTGELRDLPEVVSLGSPDEAYVLSKRTNQLRVRAAAHVWAERGARVNSLSPGIVASPMSSSELSGVGGGVMRSMIENSPAGRIGTADDIASAVEFLAGPSSSFVTGTDLLVDGGVTAALKSGRISIPQA